MNTFFEKYTFFCCCCFFRVSPEGVKGCRHTPTGSWTGLWCWIRFFSHTSPAAMPTVENLWRPAEKEFAVSFRSFSKQNQTAPEWSFCEAATSWSDERQRRAGEKVVCQVVTGKWKLILACKNNRNCSVWICNFAKK